MSNEQWKIYIVLQKARIAHCSLLIAHWAFGIRPPPVRGKGRVRGHASSTCSEHSCTASGCLSLGDELEQIRVGLHCFELGKLPLDVVRRAEEEADIGFGEHGGVVERVACGDDMIVEQFEDRKS